MTDLHYIIIEMEENRGNETQQQSYVQMLRYLRKEDLPLLACGTICSILLGGSMPILSLLLGNMADAFSNTDQMVEIAKNALIDFFIFGVVAIFAGCGMHSCWIIAAERQANRCRKDYFCKLMMQQVGWYQLQKQSTITNDFAKNTLIFQMAIGEKVSSVIMNISMFIFGLVIAFQSGWEMTLVVLVFMPVLVFSWYLNVKYYNGQTKFRQNVTKQANQIAHEALMSIKTVKQQNGQAHQLMRYRRSLLEISKQSLKFIIKISGASGFCFFCMLASFTLAFWYGSGCIQSKLGCDSTSYTGGSVIKIFYCLWTPAFCFNQVFPSIKVITEGKSAAASIFRIIDRKPQIQSMPNAIIPKQFKGVFKFENVNFSYPKDKNKNILKDLNLEIKSKSTGFMGQSGCGKSTILQLMMRFYDPDSGRITLDGTDIRQLDLVWLRNQIGYVGQEPVLFATSIRENMLLGKREASDEEIIEALKKAEIYEFIFSLKDKMETYVGSGGNQLSGGQKQRIAIARAILKNPKIMLFDEATSALDRMNEKLIQETLDKISLQKVTITVAHRLKTIMGCDQIFLFENGQLKEVKQNSQQKYKMLLKSQENDQNLTYNHKINTSIEQMQISQMPSIHLGLKTESMLRINETEQNNIIQQQQSKQGNVYCRIFQYALKHKLLLIVGTFIAVVYALAFPAMACLSGRVLSFQLLYPSDPQTYSQLMRQTSLIMLIVCFVGMLSNGLQYLIFLYVGSSVTTQIQLEAYSKILKLPVPWFDRQQNHVQSLSVNLASDSKVMSDIFSSYISHFFISISSGFFGIALAFYFQWRTALVAFVFIPLIGLVGMIQSQFITGQVQKSSDLNSQSTQMLVQTIKNLKTVISFQYQQETQKRFQSKIDQAYNSQAKRRLGVGLLIGLSHFVHFLSNGLVLYLSTIFIKDNNLSITPSLSAFFLVFFSGITVGNNVSLMSDLALVKKSALNLFKIIDHEDQDLMQIKSGSLLLKKDIKGNIEFRDVSFKYEGRSEYSLNHLNITISEKDTIGIVGQSGCGKSTILKMLLGFYTPQEGQILIEGQNIFNYDVHHLRQYFGVVNQQPTLFNESIAYNIVYNQENIDQNQIINAAIKAKLNVTSQLDHQSKQDQNSINLNQNVGPRGSHLSGGQKQRVAIARTILKNPNILLLDEATSALDAENGRLVEEYLQELMKGRTILNVTHNIEKLTNAKIFVMNEGSVVETGTYSNLIQKNGYFVRLLQGIKSH